MTGADVLQQAVDRATAALATKQRLLARRPIALGEVAGARDRLIAANKALAGEREDVARLESLSPARIWARMAGRLETDLERERAEQQAAEYVAASAAADDDRLHAELDALDAELSLLADAEAAFDAARVALVQAAGGEVAEQLEVTTAELVRATAMRQEISEAVAAAMTAQRALAEADGWLGKARDWAAYDTFGGGGLFTDAMKYDRIDKAVVLMREANKAMHALEVELRDVGGPALEIVSLGTRDITAQLDVWFDNNFSDWTVRRRVKEASERVLSAGVHVARVLADLQTRAAAVETSTAELKATRDRLLGGRSA